MPVLISIGLCGRFSRKPRPAGLPILSRAVPQRVTMPTHRRHSGSVCGFTLIELLVAIFIIALLLSILMPVLGAARRRAQTLVCQTQLRVLFDAAGQYVQNSDGWFPDTDPFPLGIGISLDINLHGSCVPSRIHFTKLMPDEPNRVSSAWYCPVKGAVPPPSGLRSMGHGTYVYNSRDLSLHEVDDEWVGRHQSKLGPTSTIGLFRDLVALDRLAGNKGNPMYEAWFDAPHDRGQNIVFLDGHVEYSSDPRWMLWPGDALQSRFSDPPPEFPHWFSGPAPPLK